MAEFRKIVRRDPLSNFQSAAPLGGTAFSAFADMANSAAEFIKPLAVEQMQAKGAAQGRAMAQEDAAGQRVQAPAPAPTGRVSSSGQAASLLGLMDRYEGGGRYDTLFGHSQRSGPFAGVDVSQMTIGQAKEFSSPKGQYGQWVKGKIGRVATPMGRHQIVGTTLRNAAEQMGLSDDTPFNQETQDAIFQHLANQRLAGASTPAQKRAAMRAEWEGFKKVSDVDLDAAIAEFEGGGRISSKGKFDPSGVSDPVVEPPQGVLIRDDAGSLTRRMYSPLSNEIMQQHRAAAGVAYLSERMNAAADDMMSLSNQYRGDPESFRGAASQYIKDAVAAAPDIAKETLRSNLTTEVQRRFMGLVDAQQTETRQRAVNSSKALIERYSSDLSDAIANDRTDEAASIQNQLEQVLLARESLPGQAWTREQSQNVVIDSVKRAEALKEQRKAKAGREVRGKLQSIVSAAESGRVAADEAILDDPAIWEVDPDLAQEAATKIELRDSNPDFLRMTPEDQAAIIAQEEGRVIESQWQTEILPFLQRQHAASVNAWQRDPIAQANEVMLPTDRPPQIGEYDGEDPTAFVASLSARKDYAYGLVEKGYIASPVFLSKAESEAISALVNQGPPEAKIAMVAAMVQGFGPDAASVMDQMKVDPVTKFGGKMVARGGSQSLALEALSGQMRADQNLVTVPASGTWREVFDTSVGDAFAGLPGEIMATSGVMDFARALYAANAMGVTDPNDQQEIMQQSIQRALGQETNARGKLEGGVQQVFGQNTLLPLGVNADALSSAMLTKPQSFIERMTSGMSMNRTGFRINSDALAAASPQGMAPVWGGADLPADPFARGDARLVAVDRGLYRIEITTGSTVTDASTPEGQVFYFDPKKLLGMTE